MNKEDFIKKAGEVFNKSNSMENPTKITIVIGNSKIFIDEAIAEEQLYLFMDDLLIARVSYEDVKDIRLMEKEDYDDFFKNIPLIEGDDNE